MTKSQLEEQQVWIAITDHVIAVDHHWDSVEFDK